MHDIPEGIRWLAASFFIHDGHVSRNISCFRLTEKE
jgi:hypothetical protein